MRDFFIQALDKLVGVFVVILAIVVVLGALTAMFSGMGPMGGGFFGGLLFLLFGGLWVVLIGGGMYLGLGIYHNTRRMAEVMERRTAS